MTNARWYQNSPQTWILKETFINGSAVLAIVRAGEWRHTWKTTGGAHGVALSRQAAQRAVRATLQRAVEVAGSHVAGPSLPDAMAAARALLGEDV